MTDESSDPTNILVVDDTIENLRLLTNMLGDQGYEVRPVTNGRQALKAVEYDPPDLILLDINMPEMNGYAVCRQLKAWDKLKDVPVIFLTALTDTADKVKAFDVGGVDYITKPFQFEEVLARVKTHVALRQAQRELSQSYERLQALEKLRDNLMQMIIHDMRTPLTVVMGRLDVLAKRPEDSLSAKAVQDLTAAREAAGAVNRMANDLLDVSRLEEGKMPVERAMCDLVEIVREVKESLAGLDARRSILVDAEQPVNVTCDGALVRRILENLVGNGIKHTPSGGGLRISIATGDNRARVAVQDEGPGIPPAAREKIFEKFGTAEIQTDRTYHSAGLGLAFCKLAVEAHGGTIGVDSGETRGSIFWFELPT